MNNTTSENATLALQFPKTVEDITPFLLLGAQKVHENRELIQMYIHLILAALFPIYIGSHASLSRPPSARVQKSKSSTAKDDSSSTMEGLTPSDALMFPIMAAAALSALYFLIKWMDDPALLNRIIGYYFSVLGALAVGKLVGDGLNVYTSFVFPDAWAMKNELFVVDGSSKTIMKWSAQGETSETGRTNPLPGRFSNVKLPESVTQKLWALRGLLRDHWILKCHIHGVVAEETRVQFNDLLGFVIGLIAVLLYNFNGKAWWLTNLMGFGFCYGTLQIMSTTTFWTGSLVLMGLFVYDIIMVFYTPMMITVATTLEAPIKLVFPGPKNGSMLGLGDVVLPGIVMALALRFDLYLHYLRLPKESSVASSQALKPLYKPSTGLWGERFWTASHSGFSTPDSQQASTNIPTGTRFRKTYFKISLVGYTAALVVTLIVLQIFKHGQPALLYLVPGVLGSLWGTALLRGDISLMWNYTEDGSLDDKKSPEEAQLAEGKPAEKAESSGRTEDKKREKKTKEAKRTLFLFSLTTPASLPSPTLRPASPSTSTVSTQKPRASILQERTVPHSESEESEEWSQSDLEEDNPSS